MGYYIDLEKITIDDYRIQLESVYLPPSRMILKDKLDERFGYFKRIGITNVQGLIHLLKKKDRFEELSRVDGPKPNKLIEFTSIPQNTIDQLAKIGITNTEKLFDKLIKKSDRQKFAVSTGIAESELLELVKLADLSRIKWVGATYAQMLYDLGVDTVEQVSKSDSVDLHARINQLIKAKNIFKGAIGLNDVKILIESAGGLPLEIEY